MNKNLDELMIALDCFIDERECRGEMCPYFDTEAREPKCDFNAIARAAKCRIEKLEYEKLERLQRGLIHCEERVQGNGDNSWCIGCPYQLKENRTMCRQDMMDDFQDLLRWGLVEVNDDKG